MSKRICPSSVFVLALLFPLAGCVKLARESPRLQQFVLSGTAPTPTVASRPGHTLGLRRLDLSSYLAVPAIVVRRGANEVLVSEFHRWGEDLGEGINRVVATNLAGLPAVQMVDIAPWQVRAKHDYFLQLHVSRFEGSTDSAATQGRIHLQATWDIINPRDGTLLVRGTTDERDGAWRVGDYAGLVTQLDSALVRLARDISACLSSFRNDSTPPQSCGSAPR